MTPASYIRSVQVDPNEVQLFYSEVVIKQYFSVALATALIYHSIITMDKEIKYFWPRPCNSVSLIYFANRYIGILGAIFVIGFNGFSETLISCDFLLWVGGICNLINVVLIDYILVIRVLAFYQQDSRLATCLKCLLGLEAVLGLGIPIYVTRREKVVVFVLGKGVTTCGITNAPPKALSIISWVIPLTFGFILLVLAIYKAAEYWKMSSGFKGFRLIKILIRDQVLYYGFVIFCCVLQIIDDSIFASSPFVADLLSAAGGPTLLCILGGQLLINLKEAGELGVNEGTNYRSDLESISDIDFAEGPQAVESSNEQSVADSAA